MGDQARWPPAAASRGSGDHAARARVLVWGFGSIGQTVAPVLQQLGAEVRGVARSAGERSGFPVVAEEDLAQELGQTDVLLMVLPSTAATTRALDADRLAALPAHAYVVNVGRGSTVDEPALVAALSEGGIAGAALDVTSTEPLPADSPLWDRAQPPAHAARRRWAAGRLRRADRRQPRGPAGRPRAAERRVALTVLTWDAAAAPVIPQTRSGVARRISVPSGR